MFSLFKGKKSGEKGKPSKATAKSIQQAQDHLNQITGSQTNEKINFEETSAKIIELFYLDELQEANSLVTEIQACYINGRLAFSAEELQEEPVLANEEMGEEERKVAVKAVHKRQREAVEGFLKREEVKRLEKDMKILHEFMKELATLNTWTKFLDKDELKIYYKKDEQLSPITVYIEGIINAPLLNVLAIVADPEGYKDWMPITPVSNILKEVTPFRKLLYLRNSVQWPLWDRESFIEGAAYIVKEENVLALSMESVKEGNWFGFPLERHPNELVEIQVNKGFTLVKQLNPKQVQTRFFVNVDVRLDSMPQSLMNWGMKNISAEIFNYVKMNSENLPEAYAKKMQDNREFFEYCQRKIDKLNPPHN